MRLATLSEHRRRYDGRFFAKDGWKGGMDRRGEMDGRMGWWMGE